MRNELIKALTLIEGDRGIKYVENVLHKTISRIVSRFRDTGRGYDYMKRAEFAYEGIKNRGSYY